MGKRLWTVLASVLATLLVFGGLPASSARATGGNLGLTVSRSVADKASAPKAAVSEYDDVLSFEARMMPDPGVELKAGAVTTLVFDRSMKLANPQLGNRPAAATAQTWDPVTNTLTVTWGAMFPGNVYGVVMSMVPSASARNTDTFQMTATTMGLALDGTPVEQTVTSDAISVEGATIPGNMPQPQPGQWSAPAYNYTLYPGNTAISWPGIAQVGATKTAFRNLQVATLWDTPNGSDQLLPKSWVNEGVSMVNEGQFVNRSYSTEGSTGIYAYGSFGGSSSSAATVARVTPPSTATPGSYSVKYQLLDDADASGTTKVVVATSYLRVVVPEPAAVTASYTATRGANSTAPGGIFEWGQQLQVGLAPDDVADLTVTSLIPSGTTLRALTGRFSRNSVAVNLKKVEYTTAAVVDDSSTWQALPLSVSAVSGAVTLPDPTVITGVRYTLNNFKGGLNAPENGVSLTLQADNAAVVGSTIPLVTKSVTYTDPVIGATSIARVAAFDKSVSVVAANADPPRVEAFDTPAGNGNVSFDRTYANGNSFNSRFLLGSDGTTPLQQPYIFIVVPKGMTTTGLSRDLCSPYSWPYQVGGCGDGVNITYPVPASNSGSRSLSDGSTLYYAQVTSGQLAYGMGGLQQLHSATTLQLRTMLAGQQNILVGMGSMSQNAFTVNAARNKNASYSAKVLSDPASYGSYAAIGSEIKSTLTGLGITADQALMGERSFNVQNATSISSFTTIKGSEDATGIVQGAGTATARPGGSVNYKVEVTNTGSAIYKNFQFINVLPAEGDTYAIKSTTPRGSQFNVNLSGNVSVQVNGAASTGAFVEYSTSSTPERFDSNGATVTGDPWQQYTGAVTGAKALRVTLAGGVEFRPGDKIMLTFDGTVPAAAPRDGKTANNSVAYRFQTGAGAWVATEAPAVPVKSSAPVGDTQLSGATFIDLNENGVQDAGEPGLNGAGVSLQLYKLEAGSPVLVGDPITPNTDGGVDGAFAFVGIDPNLDYRVKPISKNGDVTFPPAALDADGFLKYTRVTDAAANGGENTAQYVGSSTFKVGDEVGVKKWIKDLRLPLIAKTTVTGSLQLTDSADTPLIAGAGSAAAPYVKDYTVKLMQGATKKAETTTDESGRFTFASIVGLAPGDYTLVFAAPNGGKLVGSALNSSSVFSGADTAGADGTYALHNLLPGTGASDVNVYYTDTHAPVATAPALTGGATVSGTRFNPQTATLDGSDVGTRVKSYAWQLLDATDTVVASGTPAVGGGESASVLLPTSLADGSYRIVATATDLVGNVSAEQSTTFSVDKTAPVVASTGNSVTFVKGDAAAPTTAQGWIDLYGVTATDASVGLADTDAITVDASGVDTSTVGSYTVKFTATDKLGNASAAYETTYVVGFVADPTITLGSNSANHELGSTPPADDAALNALFDGVTTATSGGATVASVTIDASAVDYAAVGSYDVTFTVTDSLGYTATATGVLTVRDTTKPVITTTAAELTYADGDAKITTEAEWIAVYGAAATDSGSGIASLTVSNNTVDYTAAGVYSLTFTATDNAGNTETKSVKYTVAFAGAPSITAGNDPVRYEMGDDKPTSQADWIAAFDVRAETAPGTTQKSLQVDSSAVDFTMPSAAGYDVVFTVTDSYDNTFVYTAKYIVEDTTKPSAKSGETAVKHKQEAPAAPYTAADWLKMFDVTATDSVGGTGINPDGWTVTEGANFDAAGDYTVEFVAHDKAGNASKAVTAILTIQAPPTSDLVEMKVAQNRMVLLDPQGRSTTTGTFKSITAAALGDPSEGGTLELKGSGVIYTPKKDHFGQETAVVTVTDDLGQTADITYVFTVVKKAEVKKGVLPEYTVPVDGKLTIPVTDVLSAVDVAGLSLSKFKTPDGFVGTVKLDGDKLVFTTDGSAWSGDESFVVTLIDDLDQTVEVPVKLHVLLPKLSAEQTDGYAGQTEVALNVTGMVAGQRYTVELHSDPLLLGTITADSNGAAKLNVVIPAAAKVGSHKIVLLNAASKERAAIDFSVLEKDTPRGGGNGGGGETGQDHDLSTTGGADAGRLALLGLPLLLGGALVLAAVWLRRRQRGVGSAK